MGGARENFCIYLILGLNLSQVQLPLTPNSQRRIWVSFLRSLGLLVINLL